MGDYFLEIEAHFAARRGTPFILSAKDWALMKKWREEGIPLPVVIEAIDSVFDKNEASGRNKVISSLGYCRHAVRELWNERRELQVGEEGQVPEAAPAEALEALAREVEAAGAPVGDLPDAIRALAKEKSAPRIEERLIELEREMIDRALASVDGEEAEAMRARAEASIGRIDDSVRARTVEANLRRIVRERFGLPRLTLFR